MDDVREVRFRVPATVKLRHIQVRRAQPLQAHADALLDGRGVEPFPPNFRRQHTFVSSRPHDLADEALAMTVAVTRGRVDVIDAQVERTMDRRERRPPPLGGVRVPVPRVVDARERVAAQADPGDVQSCVAQRDLFQMVLTGATVPNLPPVDLLWTRQFPGNQERTHVFPAGIPFGQVAKEREEVHGWMP